MVRAAAGQPVPVPGARRVRRGAAGRPLLHRQRLSRPQGRGSVHGRRHPPLRGQPRRLRRHRLRHQPHGGVDRPRGDPAAGSRGLPDGGRGPARRVAARGRAPLPDRLPPLRRLRRAREVLPLGEGDRLRSVRQGRGPVPRVPGRPGLAPPPERAGVPGLRRPERGRRQVLARYVPRLQDRTARPGAGPEGAMRLPALPPRERVSPPRRRSDAAPPLRHRVLQPAPQGDPQGAVLQEAGREGPRARRGGRTPLAGDGGALRSRPANPPGRRDRPPAPLGLPPLPADVQPPPAPRPGADLPPDRRDRGRAPASGAGDEPLRSAALPEPPVPLRHLGPQVARHLLRPRLSRRARPVRIEPPRHRRRQGPQRRLGRMDQHHRQVLEGQALLRGPLRGAAAGLAERPGAGEGGVDRRRAGRQPAPRRRDPLRGRRVPSSSPRTASTRCSPTRPISATSSTAS